MKDARMIGAVDVPEAESRQHQLRDEQRRRYGPALPGAQAVHADPGAGG